MSKNIIRNETESSFVNIYVCKQSTTTLVPFSSETSHPILMFNKCIHRYKYVGLQLNDGNQSSSVHIVQTISDFSTVKLH